MNIQIPDWCVIGNRFEWEAKNITGADVVSERIIGYTKNGFLHTSCYCPVYETPFDNLHTGKVIKGAN